MGERSSEDQLDVAIIGAGAAGLMAGIWIKRLRPTLRVIAVDGARKLGAKILVAGGGRCNVTNCVVTETDFNATNRGTLKRVLRAYTVEQTVAFFREIGVELHEEANGKLFPDTNRAQAVLDALLAESERRNLEIRTEWRVTGVRRSDEGFVVASVDDELRARRVVLAAGGQSLPKSGSDGSGFALAKSLGHSIVPPTPALEPLKLDGEIHRSLSGVSQDVQLSVHVEGAKPVRRRGSMLWTHFGVSGPVVLDISRHWRRAELEGKSARVNVNTLPDDDFNSADRRILDASTEKPRASLNSLLVQWMPARVEEALVKSVGLATQTPLGKLRREDRRKLVHALTEFAIPVVGGRGYTYAEATAGGVPLNEVDIGLASRVCPGLYFAGEVLDVDGRIGGFNFQWAWSSGYVVANSIVVAFSADES